MRKKLKEKKAIKIRNKKLVKKYPWLKPYHVWSGKPFKDYDYSYTWLDDMPDGWRKAFGMMMVKEIDEVLQKCNYQNLYKVVQVKEKYGSLRWYDNGVPHIIYDEYSQIINKYYYLSENICVICGKPDVYMTFSGWDYPLCERCWSKHINDTRLYKDVISDKDTGRMADTYTIRRFDKDNGSTDITYDIHETADKIRRNYVATRRRSIRRLQKKGLGGEYMVAKSTDM